MMEKEFEDYWQMHQRRLILNAPRELRDEYTESTKLDTPLDWICFVLPVALGIFLQPYLHIESEMLSWAVIVLVVVVAFVLLQMVKPFLQKKKSPSQAVEQIKRYYYDRYKKFGLDKVEPWQ